MSAQPALRYMIDELSDFCRNDRKMHGVASLRPLSCASMEMVQTETTPIVTFIVRSPETSGGILSSGKEGAPHNAKRAETYSEPLTLRS